MTREELRALLEAENERLSVTWADDKNERTEDYHFACDYCRGANSRTETILDLYDVLKQLQHFNHHIIEEEDWRINEAIEKLEARLKGDLNVRS